jgi:hypothetical protein
VSRSIAVFPEVDKNKRKPLKIQSRADGPHEDERRRLR